MTMTDPVADMLTRIRNANTAMHDSVKMPSSKLKESLAVILQREGYIAGFDVARLRWRGAGQRPRDPAQVRAGPHAHHRRPAPSVRGPDCASTRAPTACHGYWVAWAWRSCPPATGS